MNKLLILLVVIQFIILLILIYVYIKMNNNKIYNKTEQFLSTKISDACKTLPHNNINNINNNIIDNNDNFIPSNYFQFNDNVHAIKSNIRILSKTAKGLPLDQLQNVNIPEAYNYTFDNSPALLDLDK